MPAAIAPGCGAVDQVFGRGRAKPTRIHPQIRRSVYTEFSFTSVVGAVHVQLRPDSPEDRGASLRCYPGLQPRSVRLLRPRKERCQ